MSSKISSNSLSNLISVLAVIIALISVIFTYRVYKIENKEILLIRARKIRENYIIKIDTSHEHIPILPHLWQCTITNIGKRTSSIIDYQVYICANDPLDSIKPYIPFKHLKYLDQGLFLL